MYRVPPFLLSIEDPRAAQGGSLNGCPVCGGMYITGCILFENNRAHSIQVLVTVSPTARSWRTHSADRWPRTEEPTRGVVIKADHLVLKFLARYILHMYIYLFSSKLDC